MERWRLKAAVGTILARWRQRALACTFDAFVQRVEYARKQRAAVLRWRNSLAARWGTGVVAKTRTLLHALLVQSLGVACSDSGGAISLRPSSNTPHTQHLHPDLLRSCFSLWRRTAWLGACVAAMAARRHSRLASAVLREWREVAWLEPRMHAAEVFLVMSPKKRECQLHKGGGIFCMCWLHPFMRALCG